MSVGIKIAGREVTMTVGGLTLLGVLSKNLTFAQELADTRDDQAGGWSQFAAEALTKSIEFGISGQLKNLELASAFFGTSQIFAVVLTYPDGSTIAFDAAMTTAPTFTHENDTVSTYEVGYTSSGTPVYTAGT
jgi:predicted secreted protein